MDSSRLFDRVWVYHRRMTMEVVLFLTPPNDQVKAQEIGMLDK